MRVNGRNIGKQVDDLYEEIERRAKEEARRELKLIPFEGAAFSNVRWKLGRINIGIHKDLPTHAVPHALAVALHHVRQRLDRYPDVHRPYPGGSEEASPVRTSLRELVLAPEAELHIAELGLDREWETQQRHDAMKQLIEQAPKAWLRKGNLGNTFAALQYARMELEHPPTMWRSLRKSMRERMPVASELGAEVAKAVKKRGWASSEACFDSLVEARDLLRLKREALIGDRQSGEMR
jgi:hypothetical protein